MEKQRNESILSRFLKGVVIALGLSCLVFQVAYWQPS